MTVLFLHGLEGSPQGYKATRLARRYGAVVPAIDNAAVVAARAGGDGAARRAAWLGSLAQARDAVRAARPRVLVGSSFGGALAVRLAQEGVHTGPMVLLAPAARTMLGDDAALPRGTRAIVLHGRGDGIIPVDDARWLAATGGPGVVYWEVDDDHGLGATVDAGWMELAVEWFLRGS